MAIVDETSAQRRPAEALYYKIVAHARQPAFYRDFGVPDTLDGRFDMIVLLVALVVRRLRAEAASPAAWHMAGDLFEVLFADMDRSLREMGVTDTRVGRHVRAMAQAYYGRSHAYDAALDGAETLEAAVARNLYGTAEPGAEALARMAAYIQDAVAGLDRQPLARIVAGDPGFVSP